MGLEPVDLDVLGFADEFLDEKLLAGLAVVSAQFDDLLVDLDAPVAVEFLGC